MRQLVVAVVLAANLAFAAEPIPYHQDNPPGSPLSPQQALQKMVVPSGFSVELVIAEPELINPVAMTIDERGRFWIAESIEYPRHEPGRGKDRIKVFEDTDRDGKFDRSEIFADGLNIPSGIVIGRGGVWVANAPDILFYKLGSDGRAVGPPEVVVTGFGRDDTHELPNSLTWGPDGWLYGLNGVFNRSVVKSNNGKTYEFTCAMFRIHPQTHEFQIFCEGTSNPWGLAFDGDGSAFVSACVIDHLWHLVETGYYRRQAGEYPQFTWLIESIVKHHHQKAAYCGLHYFDSDAYPEEYREMLYMGNIHGACINVDKLQHDGSTYSATGQPDFLAANDPWFMPISQKTGPDGCLYVLDWYDRYHCYQDASRDAPGVDRQQGRLYRIRYNGTPRAAPLNLAQESDDQLIARLASANIYFRDLAQRLLSERMHPELQSKLQSLVLNQSQPRKGRLHALWSLIGAGPLDRQFHLILLASDDSTFRAWGVRAAGDRNGEVEEIRERIVALTSDKDAEVRLQTAIASRKLKHLNAVPLLLRVLSKSDGDQLLPHIVWQNLHPFIESDPARFVKALEKYDLTQANPVADLLPRIAARLLAIGDESVVGLYELLLHQAHDQTAALQSQLAQLSRMIADKEISREQLRSLARRLDTMLIELRGGNNALGYEVQLLAAGVERPGASAELLEACQSTTIKPADRLRGLEMLLTKRESGAIQLARDIICDERSPLDARATMLTALRRCDDVGVAGEMLAAYSNFPPELQAKTISLLTERPGWSKSLLRAIGRKQLPPTVLNATQIANLLAGRDEELQRLIAEHWGAIRSERNPQREQVVNEMRQLIGSKRGDALAGAAVFKKTCAQCHQIFGHGFDVGPDLTSNGRNDFNQLLSNVFDPSLVIGRAYQAVSVVTSDGRSISGLLVEDGQARVVLKLQGGKQEIVRRDEIDAFQLSKLSLMPEGFEKQLQPEEIINLFAFLALEQAPEGWPEVELPTHKS
ncbi:MAG: c-type cytochrome [Pirellulales bacterium]|nr:c-type cytochrome [Pirellulales bacterium]